MDICFLFDITSSTTLEDLARLLELYHELIVDYRLKHLSDQTVRTAFACYWDYATNTEAESNQKVASIIQPFNFYWEPTDVIKAIRREAESPHWYHGQDYAEAFLAGVMVTATQLCWTSDVRILCVITDAPGHGFAKICGWKMSDLKNTSFDDDYPDGDPTGLTIESVLQSLNETVGLSKLVCIDSFDDSLATHPLQSYVERLRNIAQFPVEYTKYFNPLPLSSVCLRKALLFRITPVSSLKYLASQQVDPEKFNQHHKIPQELREYLRDSRGIAELEIEID
jgi:hypothetical protein